MNNRVALPPNSSLSALRGAVGEVVGAADAVGGWDRMVALWRIFWALDGLVALLWSIVDRLRAGEMGLDGLRPAEAVAVRVERPVVAGAGLVLRSARRRASLLRPALTGSAVAGVRAMSARCVGLGAVAWPGWALADRDLFGISAVLAVRGQRFSNLGWGAVQNCA